LSAPRSKIERWLDDAREELRTMPQDHPRRWMLARQLELIAAGVKLHRGDDAGTQH
jgi:hypothetical protein